MGSSNRSTGFGEVDVYWVLGHIIGVKDTRLPCNLARLICAYWRRQEEVGFTCLHKESQE